MADENGQQTKITNRYEAAVAIAQRTVLGILLAGVLYGVHLYLERDHELTHRNVNTLLNRCLPGVTDFPGETP